MRCAPARRCDELGGELAVPLRDRRPGGRRCATSGGEPPPHPGRASTRADRIRDRLGGLVLDDRPDPVGQQLDGVREAGRHDRLARGDGLDQHARGHLDARVVRQQHDVGAGDPLGERRRDRGTGRRTSPDRRRRVRRRERGGRRGTPRRRARRPWDGSHPAPRSATGGSGRRAAASARMPHSIPLPGPIRPQVSIVR